MKAPVSMECGYFSTKDAAEHPIPAGCRVMVRERDLLLDLISAILADCHDQMSPTLRARAKAALNQ